MVDPHYGTHEFKPESPRAPTGDPQRAARRGWVAASASMRQLMEVVGRYAKLSWPVLINGESGTGKEHIARALHEQSPRARQPFIAVNAGGIASNLIESELFGHRKGSFTGATHDHQGFFQLSNHGTLFLDEIGELPLSLQARLLRVLEHWQVRPVGGDRWQPVNVRLVCATHRNLIDLADRGDFRHDLYYRLARLVVRVPPLRERRCDIRRLAHSFLKEAEPEVGVRMLTEHAVDRLNAYRWPGNVRELKNVLFCAAATCDQPVVDASDIDRALIQIGGDGLKDALEPEQLLDTVRKHGGNLSAAARALGIPRTTLRDRLKNSRPEALAAISSSR